MSLGNNIVNIKQLSYTGTTATPTTAVVGFQTRNKRYIHIGVTTTNSVTYRLWLKLNDVWYPDSGADGSGGMSTVNTNDFPFGKNIEIREIMGLEYLYIEIVAITGSADFNIGASGHI